MNYESEEVFDLTQFLCQTEIAAIFLDSDNRVRNYTPACEQYFNLTSSDIGRPIEDLVPRLRDTTLNEDIAHAMQELTSKEKLVKTSNAKTFIRRIIPARTDEKAIQGIVLTYTDISKIQETHEIESELRDSQSRLTLLTDAIPVLVAYVDRNYIYRFCNAQYQTWFGLAKEEVVGKSLQEVLGDTVFQTIKPLIAKVFQGEKISFNDELLYRHGNPRHVHVEYIPHLSPSKEVIGFYAMISDITEQVLANRSQERLATIVEHSSDAILAVDLNGIVMDWNGGAEIIFGYTAEEMVGKSVSCLTPSEKEREFEEIMDAVKQGTETKQLETTRIGSNGKRLNVLLTVSPIRNSQNEVIATSTIAQDITSHVKAERELKLWTDGLEKKVAERTAAAEKQASELQNLAIQITSLEQLSRKKLAESIHNDLQQLLVAIKMRLPDSDGIATGEELEQISHLIDEALNRTRVIVSELNPAVLQHGTFVDALEWLVEHMEERYQLNVELNCQERFEDVNESLRTVCFEVIRELLLNVVTQEETNHTFLKVRRKKNALEVYISDSGRGFNPTLIDAKPTGYGLLSVRDRISAFAGSIQIISVPSGGARFLLTLPLEKTETSPSRLLKNTSTRGAKRVPDKNGNVCILIVDDEKLVREGLANLLKSENDFQIVGEASDGLEAVHRADQLRPDIILMDVTMPQMNGLEATEEISSQFPDSTIIGLSLHDENLMAPAMLKAGASAYLQKDLAGTKLIPLIRMHVLDESR